MKKKIGVIILIVLLAIIVSSCSFSGKNSTENSNQTESQNESSQVSTYNSDVKSENSTVDPTEQSSVSEENSETQNESHVQESSETSDVKEISENSMTMEEIVLYAIRQNGMEETEENIKSKTASYEAYSKDYPDMTAEQFSERVRKDLIIWESTQKVSERFLDMYCSHFGFKKEDKFKEPIYANVAHLEDMFFGFDDDTYLKMMSLLLEDEGIESLIRYGISGLYHMPFKQAQLAGIKFDTTKRLNIDNLKELISRTQQIEDAEERQTYFREEIKKLQAYPDYLINVSDPRLFYRLDNQKFDPSDSFVLFTTNEIDYKIKGCKYFEIDENNNKQYFAYKLYSNEIELSSD